MSISDRHDSSMTRLLCILLAMTFAASSSARAADASSPPAGLCATPAQAATIRAAIAGKEPGPLFSVAANLKLPEGLVLSALPTAEAHGVSPIHFAAIWKSLEMWDDALTLVTKGANIIEIRGQVGIGEPSKRSKFFNLSRKGGGLNGHLRPDLYSAIYGISRTGKESSLQGVAFVDQTGEVVFTVYLPSEGETPPASLVKQFEGTWNLLRSLPALCPK